MVIAVTAVVLVTVMVGLKRVMVKPFVCVNLNKFVYYMVGINARARSNNV